VNGHLVPAAAEPLNDLCDRRILRQHHKRLPGRRRPMRARMVDRRAETPEGGFGHGRSRTASTGTSGLPATHFAARPRIGYVTGFVPKTAC
jgi:hypothetical protein